MTLRSTLLLTLLAAAPGAGCATAMPEQLVAETLRPPFTGAPVRIDGLGYLELYMSHARAMDLMRAHGYTCHLEAATARYAPCTRTGGPGPRAVVLAFEGTALAAVRTELVVTDKDPRDQFDRIYARERKRYLHSYMEQSELVYFARFMPGDGSVIELRYFIFADAMETEHRAPAPQIALLTDRP